VTAVHATGLAEDYEALAAEVLHRMAQLADEAAQTQEVTSV
jgi:chromosome partitioning protein